MSGPPVVAAFFDVDETLITVKSMFDFLKYFGESDGTINSGEAIERIHRLSASGVDRENVNLAFWRLFRGASKSRFRQLADLWASDRLRNREEFIVASSYERMIAHRRNGDYVALVSGSSIDILSPLAREFRVNSLLATRQLATEDVFTGETERPIMIGAGKRQAIETLASACNLQLNRSYAYGDHVTDLPMLEAVGNPIVVGNDRALRKIANARGWLHISERLPLAVTGGAS
jgi:HAD superfamily hydrolase (TIGR01490 family)